MQINTYFSASPPPPKKWEPNILVTYQSNKREYNVLANPSLPTVAASGSRLLLITSSGVTITRFSSASSSAWWSHLKIFINEFSQQTHEKGSNMCVCVCGEWEREGGSEREKALFIHEKFYCCSKVELGILIFHNWWINFFSLGKFYVTEMKNCSNDSENRFLNGVGNNCKITLYSTVT